MTGVVPTETQTTAMNKRRSRIGAWLNAVALVVVMAFFLMPIYFAVVNSLKTPQALAESPLTLPTVLNFANYVQAAAQMNYPRVVSNTVLITALSSVLTLLVSSLAAYPLARLTARWISGVYQLFLLGLTLPFLVLLIPLYLLVRDLGLLGTVPGIVLVYTALNIPFATFFTAGFVRTVPVELEDAAAVDGCTPFQTFCYIVLPLLRPASATLAMFLTLGIWNDFLLPLLFFTRPESGTVMPAVYSFVGQFSTDQTVLLASAILASLPLLLFFFALQRQIIAGIAAGAVKG